MTYETDTAFLEDYLFMRANGESHDTAATRFGVSANTLLRRVERTRQRVRESSISPAISGRIGDGAEELGLLDADPPLVLAERA